MVDWSKVALAGVFGGLLALERRAFLQAMFSRPLVACTLMGVLLDDPPSGLFVGMVLELFYLGSASLGAALAENDTLSATGTAAAAAAMASGTGAPSTPAFWSAGILLFIALGRWGRWMDRRLERYSTRLAKKALASAEEGNLDRAIRQNLWAMWPHFVVFAGATAMCAVIGYVVGPQLERLSLDLTRGLAWAYPAIASVAAAIAARGSHARQAGLFAGGAAVLVVIGAAALRLMGGAL